MKIICQECHRKIGEKVPLDDLRSTHTICPECIEKKFKGPEKGDSGRSLLKRSGVK